MKLDITAAGIKKAQLEMDLGKCLLSQGIGPAFSQRLENRIVKLRAKIKALAL